jgi:hypothetical protein
MLYDTVARLVGAHDRFAAGSLPADRATPAVLFAARRGSPEPALRAVDDLARALGDTEVRLAECTAGEAAARATHDAVESALGYTALGRLERAALGAARRVRRVQQRITPPSRR